MTCTYCHTALPSAALYCCTCGRKQRNAPAPHRRHRPRARAQGSITKLPGNRKEPYWARGPAEYAEDGSIIRPSLGCYATYAAAAEALGRALYAPKVPPTAKITLCDIYDRFVESHYFNRLSKSTQGSHRTAWKHLASCVQTPVNEITTETFQKPIDELLQQGLKRETVSKIRNLASLLCKEAMRLNLITVNFGALIQLPKKDSASIPPFTNKQLKLLWDTADAGDTDAMAVLVMCYTGMRPSELLKIDIGTHMHLADPHWYISGNGIKTDAGYNRLIPIPPIIRPIITSLIDNRSRGPLIAAPKGGYYRLDNWRPRCFIPLMDKLSIADHVPYSCRHTYADLQKRRHVDPLVMAAIMGHEDYATTVEHYQTTTIDDIARICSAVEKMDRP